MLKRILCLALAATWLTSPSRVFAEDPAPEPEAPESAVSSPPMEMDDPATPGKNGIEVNFVGSVFHLGPGRSSEGLLDANIGIGDRIQLKYERPYAREHDAGLPLQTGLGATELGIKWRFFDSHGLAIAFYPNYSFDDAFRLKDENGDPEETEGRNAYFPLLVSKAIGEYTTLAFNYGYRRNLEHKGDDNSVALGIGRAIGHDSRVLAELFSERDESFHNRQTDVRVGYCVLPFASMFEHLKYETPVYASLGHSIGANEAHETALSVVFGVSFILKPAE